MSRRHSVVDAYGIVETKIRDTMTNLSRLWDEVSMPDSMRLKRVDSAFKNIIELCDEMHSGEIDMVANVKRGVKDNQQAVNKMRLELEMPIFQKPSDMNDNSIALLRHLQAEVKNLEDEFNRRHEEQKVLIEKIEILKQRLESDFTFGYETHRLFPVDVFKRFEKERAEMEEILIHRYNKIEKYQADIKQWRQFANSVEMYVADDDVLKELLQQNVDSERFVFSDRVLELFESYHNELHPLYNAWLEDIEYRWTEKYECLAELWQKCHVAAVDRRFQARFEPGRHTEETLSKMEEECEKLKKKYESCKTVFEMIEKWKEVWDEKLGIERRRKQPDYYKKANVLPDNKRERELIGLMERIESKIRVANSKYEEENQDKLLIQELPPNEYIENVKEEHRQELKFELQLKKEEKTRIQSPQPTPKSQKRPNPFFRTPKSAAPAVKRLNFEAGLSPCPSPIGADGISFITPIRRQPNGPKTSSPKEARPRTTTPMSRRINTPASTSAASSRRPMSRKN